MGAVPNALRTPEIAELRVLCAAADLGSLGRAAQRLRLSQPAVSRRIAGLEALAGTPLLDRTPRGVALTAAGRRLYEEARPLLEHAAIVEQTVAELARATQPVRVAASHSAAEALVGSALSGVSGEQLSVELVVLNSERVRMRVAVGKADVGVAAGDPDSAPYPGTRQETLCEDEVVVAVPLRHPWARVGSVDLREFLATPMVLRDPRSAARATVDALLTARHLDPAAPLAELSTPHAARQEALERGAPLMLSRRLLEDRRDFEIVEVEGLRFMRAYIAVLPARGTPTPAVEAVLERLRARARSYGPHPGGEAGTGLRARTSAR